MIDYVFGLNKSGIALTKLLKKQGKNFFCWDDNEKIRNTLSKKHPELKFEKIVNYSKKKYRNIYLTPGISFFDRRFKGITISKFKRDLNLYYENINDEKIIAITGTNGKSTTTKLVAEIIKKKYKQTFVGGNIGNALCNAFSNYTKFSHHVIELSSFQLETIKNFEPNISILLNLSEDHLDRYKSMREYISAKKNIFNKNNKNINLISIDDKYSKKIFDSKKVLNKISFSIKNENADISYKEGNIIDNYFYKKNKKIKLYKISSALNSNFNIQNILVAYIVVKFLKIPIMYFYETVKNFKGLPYRSTIIYNSSKKLIINNSKATNISSALLSLENKKNIYLILGGIAKEKGFEKFRNFKKELKKIYIYGRSRVDIDKQINLKVTKKFLNLKAVIDKMWEDISYQDIKVTIIFAPACASFDQFENFEKRGDCFNKLINKRIKK